MVLLLQAMLLGHTGKGTVARLVQGVVVLDAVWVPSGGGCPDSGEAAVPSGLAWKSHGPCPPRSTGDRRSRGSYFAEKDTGVPWWESTPLAHQTSR